MSVQFIEAFGIDWLTITKHYDANFAEEKAMPADDWAWHWLEIIRHEVGNGSDLFIRQKPVKDYRWSFISREDGTVVNIPENIRYQGARVIKSSTTLSHYTQPRSMVQYALEAGWKVTRMDWQITIRNTAEKPKSYMADYEKYLADGGVKYKVGYHEENGQTFELGARSSAFFTRIYEKGKERKDKTDAIRVEAEFKEGYAMQVATQYVAGRDKAICAVMMERLSFMSHTQTYRIMREFVGDIAPMQLNMPRKKTNTMNWLEGTVRQAFIKHARINPLEAYEWLKGLENTLDAIAKGEYHEENY